MTSMPNRQLGKNGPKVSAIGFGAMGFAGFYGVSGSDEERFQVLERAIELGSTFIDSSDVYGDNEDLLGKFFQKYPQQREKVFLATKFANAKSLKRLNLDYIDLYYAHRIDKTVPIEETMSVLKELVEEGKIKYIGLSECSSDTLRRAYAIHPIAAVQIEYSPFSLDIEHKEIGLLKTCRQLGVAIVCYSPLGRGILTGQIKSLDDLEENDSRRRMPRFSQENFKKNLHLVDILTSLAKKKNCTSSQLTLAWILAQGEDFIVIPGTTKVKNLEENIAAAQIQLTKDEIEEIRHACESTNIIGGRYPEALSALLYADSAPKQN
ncbi:hypothetical protein I4U23_026790 [Adineta vaga]|nr:hypothetical protein I4U23_026790 [Adineta vaga]